MDFYDVVENRTSVKKFKNTPLEKGKLDRMINSAMMAPSWKNQTSYKIIMVNDKNKKECIANTIMNSTNDAKIAIEDAPILAVVVSDPSLSGNIDNKEYYLVDGAIAMEHFVLAASNEGYGTCWIGAFNEEQVKSILNIPTNYKVIAMTPVGEIEECKAHYEKKDVRDYVFTNDWNKPYMS